MGYYMNREIRQAVHNRACNKCETCGSTQNLEVHHIKTWAKGGTNDLTNLKLLCEVCHGKVRISNRMMEGTFKTINVTFENNEYALLYESKGKLSWHDFIMRSKDVVGVVSTGLVKIKATCPKCGNQLLVSLSDLEMKTE